MQQGWLAPSFAAALEAGPQALLAHAQQVAPGVYAFDMLSEAFCTQATLTLTLTLTLTQTLTLLSEAFCTQARVRV